MATVIKPVDVSQKGGNSRRSSATSSTMSAASRQQRASTSNSSQHQQRDASQERAASSASSPRTARGRHNKIYHCPPTPPPRELLGMEKGFVLDSRAVSSISIDYSKTNPKLGAVTRPYNAQLDRHTRQYYTFHGLERTLKRTQQHVEQPTFSSIEGRVTDRFYNSGAGYQYLSLRNQFGAGHSREAVDGHAQFMQGIKPVKGYNGDYGFRRNTPWLRQMPSPFGTSTLSSTY